MVDSQLARAFFQSTSAGNMTKMEKYLNEAPDVIHEVDHQGWTALHHACLVGNLTIATRLIDCKADPRKACSQGSTPLHVAIQWEQDAITEMLLDAGADMHASDSAGRTPFQDAPEHIKEMFAQRQKEADDDDELPEMEDVEVEEVPMLAPQAPVEGESLFTIDLEDDTWDIDVADLKYLDKLGEGEFSVVYHGRWRGADVAIKEIPLRNESITVFKRELEVLTKFRHPQLVLFMGACTSVQPYRLVTEYCAGGSLYDLIHKSQVELTWMQRIKILLDIGKGIHFLQSNRPPIIHGDLKSTNVLAVQRVNCETDVPMVKITDFGTQVKTATDDALSDAGRAFHWMAPEILQNADFDERVDIYSFGIILYEVCSNHLPFDDIDMAPVAIAIAVTRGERPEIANIPDSCPDDLIPIMEECWDMDPNNRPDSHTICTVLKTTWYLVSA